MKALLNDPTYNDLKKLISKKNRETTINVITILYSYLVIQTYCYFCFFYCHCLVNILLSPSHTCCREFLIIIIIIIVQICLCLRRLLCFALLFILCVNFSVCFTLLYFFVLFLSLASFFTFFHLTLFLLDVTYFFVLVENFRIYLMINFVIVVQ